MMSKLVDVDYERGKFNDWPAEAVEIPASRHAETLQHLWLTYTPDVIEYRQAVDPKTEVWTNMRLFWNSDGGGVMMTTTRDGKDWRSMKTKLHLYTIGCDHKYIEMTIDECRKAGVHHFGNCYHVSKCSKCGHIRSVDSSG